MNRRDALPPGSSPAAHEKMSRTSPMQRRAPPTCRSRVTWREKLKEARSPHYFFGPGRAARGRPSRRNPCAGDASAATPGCPHSPCAPGPGNSRTATGHPHERHERTGQGTVIHHVADHAHGQHLLRLRSGRQRQRRRVGEHARGPAPHGGEVGGARGGPFSPFSDEGDAAARKERGAAKRRGRPGRRAARVSGGPCGS